MNKRAFSSWSLYSLILFSIALPHVRAELAPIPNGARAGEDEAPSVVMIDIIGPDGTGFCTGTFITPNHVLTAGHCIVSPESGIPNMIWHVRSEGKDFVSLDGVAHPEFIKRTASGPEIEWEHDVGMITFSEAHTAISPVSTKEAAPSERVALFGFGKDYVIEPKIRPNDLALTDPTEALPNGSGIKRKGQNIITEIAKDGIYTVGKNRPDSAASFSTLGTGLFAGLSSGDSGGPLLRDGEVIGVASRGSMYSLEKLKQMGRITVIPNWVTPANEGDFGLCVHANVTSGSNLAFIASML